MYFEYGSPPWIQLGALSPQARRDEWGTAGAALPEHALLKLSTPLPALESSTPTGPRQPLLALLWCDAAGKLWARELGVTNGWQNLLDVQRFRGARPAKPAAGGSIKGKLNDEFSLGSIEGQ